MIVSSGWIRTERWSPRAIRASAESGSPCEPVETMHQLLVGQLHRLVQLDEQTVGHVEEAQLGGQPHVAHHRAADQADPPPVRGGGVEHLLHPVHVAGEAGDDDPGVGDRWNTPSSTGPISRSAITNPGTSALVESTRNRSTPSSPSREKPARSVSRPSSGSWSSLMSPVCSTSPAGVRIATASASGIEWLTAKYSQSNAPWCSRVALLHLEQVRGEPVLLALGRDEGEREPGADDRQLGPLAQQERHRADVVLVTVGEHERVDVVEPVLDGPEVRQDQVDAGRVLGREQHAAVDDEQPPVVLEHGHVAADLADAAERDHAQRAVRAAGAAGRTAARPG